MKILAFPKYSLSSNPNIYNLYKNFENNKNFFIDEFNLIKPFFKKYDIFHLHWPDYFFVKSFILTLIRVTYFFLITLILKLNGSKVIWTVHNIKPHNDYHPRFFKLTMLFWTRFIDGYISMSEESKRQTCKVYPSLKKKKISIIFHGLYTNYPNKVSKKYARIKLGIPLKKKVLLFFGRLERYKNILLLIKKFNNLSNNYFLIIAGKANDQKLLNEVIFKTKNNKNIKLYSRFIHNDKVQFFFNSCDIVVLPFKNILNSGSIMLALSFAKPVYCPNKGSLRELNKIIGKNIINTFDKFSLNKIGTVIKKSGKSNFKNFEQFENKILSKKLKKFYLEINKNV